MFLERLAPAWEDYRHRLMLHVRLLVVDDESEVADYLAERFSAEGYNVDVATSAEEAWDKLRRSRYDLLVTDKNLPGESGLDLIARVRAESMAVPTILMTGYPSVETVTELLAKGAADYVIKPVEVPHVLARMRSILDRRTNGLLFDRIVKDLAIAMKDGGIDPRTVTSLNEELSAYRVALGSGPKVLLLDDPLSSSPAVASALERAELFTVTDDAAAAVDMASAPGGPLVTLFDVGRAGAHELIWIC